MSGDDASKNEKQLVCVRCSSKILPPGLGTFVESEFQLAPFKKEQEENVKHFYRVEDMFDFDNLGFTHTVDNIKFLSCADCELGPIGYHDLNTRRSFVAVSRVQTAS